MEEEKINLVINQIKQDIDLQSAALSDEYYYQSLPLCVIDSVFSIEINYKITRNVVIKYCNYYDLQRIQSRKGELPKIEEQEAISSLLIKYENEGINKFTEEIYDNRNRTSAKSGILKSEAVYEFARVLKKYDIDYLQDISKIIHNSEFKKEIKRIKGQNSGISLSYFFMLAGEDYLIKPDRMIIRYFYNLGILKNENIDQFNIKIVNEVLNLIVKNLRSEFTHINSKLLDHQIWKFQSNRSSN